MPRAEDRRVCHHSLHSEKCVCVCARLSCGWRENELHWSGLILFKHVLCWCVCICEDGVFVCLGFTLAWSDSVCVCVQGQEVFWHRGFPTVLRLHPHTQLCTTQSNLAIGLHTHIETRPSSAAATITTFFTPLNSFPDLFQMKKIVWNGNEIMAQAPHSATNSPPLHPSRHFAFLLSGSSIACHRVSGGSYGLLK